MNGQSTLPLASLCSSLVLRCTTCYSEINHAVTQCQSQNVDLGGLEMLAGLIHEAAEYTGQLQEALEQQPPVAELGHAAMTESWPKLEGVYARLSKQLMRIEPETIANVKGEYLQVHLNVVTAHNKLVAMFVDVLSMPSVELQEMKLHSQSNLYLAALDVAAAASTADDIFTWTAPAAGHSTVNRHSVMLPPYSVAEGGEEPPSFERTMSATSVVTSDSSRRGSTAADTLSETQTIDTVDTKTVDAPTKDQTSRLRMSSLTSPFRAMASRVLPKQDVMAHALCSAVTAGDLTQITGLLQQDANPNGRSDAGDTPMDCAIQAHNLDAAKLLLYANANLDNFGRNSNYPPLFYAAIVGHYDMALTFLKSGADMNQLRKSNATPYFVELCKAQHTDAVKFLLENGADPNLSAAVGRYPIMYAVREDNFDMAEMLLSRGANPNASDLRNASPLALAVKKGNTRIAACLLDHGANADSVTLVGSRVLADAIARHNVSIAKLLLSYHARANDAPLDGGSLVNQVLDDKLLSEADKADLVPLLVANGASVAPKGRPCARVAMEAGVLDALSVLLANGGDVDTKMSSGEPLLCYAIMEKRMDIVKLLRWHGADVNAQDAQGNASLAYARAARDDMLVAALLQAGAQDDFAVARPSDEDGRSGARAAGYLHLDQMRSKYE